MTTRLSAAELLEVVADADSFECWDSPAVEYPVDQAYADELTASPARHRALPVLGWDGSILGVVTLDRLARVPLDQRASIRVQDVALPMSMVGTASPDEELLATAGRFGLGELGLLLVFDTGRLAGIVTAADLQRTVPPVATAATVGALSIAGMRPGRQDA